jgi:basic amino acid/polyamine antiporter, APA family
MSVATRRPLGFFTATALVVGNMVGSGVFLLPASLAPYGAASLLGWALSVSGVLLLAVVFARLGKRFPVCGGPYAYTRLAFGDLAGFVMAWSYWISVWCAVAAIAIAFVGSIGALLPEVVATPGRSAACALGVLWLCTLCNFAGLRAAGLAQLVITVLKLLPLVAIVAVGAHALNMQNLHPFNPSSESLLGVTTTTAALALWALCGFECATIPAEHVHDAERTVPRATLVGVVIAAAMTVAACTIVLGLVPLEALKNSSAPFADAARALWGDWAAAAMAAAMAVSCLGALNGWILVMGQIPFAAARDGLFPAFFSKVDQQATPRNGLLVGSLLATGLVGANFNGSLVTVFTASILLSTTASLLPYALSAAALLKLEKGRGGYVAWLKLAAVLALIYSIWALIGAGEQALLWGAGLLLAGLPIYAVMRSRNKAAAPALT